MTNTTNNPEQQSPEQEEAKVIANLQDAKNALLRVRIVTSELDSGITNVNRGNPMLARALRDKVKSIRGELDTLELYLAARSTNPSNEGDSDNGEVQQEKQSSSEETSSGKETSATEGNAPADKDNDDDRPMTTAEKIAARKAQQKDKDNASN